MKAAVVTEPYKVEIKEIDRPALKDTDVLIKVKTVGICGSDLHLFKGTHAFRKPPAILGHEIAGEVIEVGERVKAVSVGDRVTIEPQVGCGLCEHCKGGNVNRCLKKLVPGTPQWLGTFVEYFAAPESTVYKLSDSVSFETGTMIEPLAVAVHAMNRSIGGNGTDCAILGCGTIGLLLLSIASQYGFSKVFCTDTAPFNRKLASEMGAAVYDPIASNPAAEIKDATGGRGVDVVFVAAGAKNIIDQASQMTRKGGKIVLVAMITEEIPVYSYGLVFNEQSLTGSMTYTTEAFKKACDLINNGLNVDKIISHVLPLEQTQQGLSMLNEKKQDIAKILIKI